jgi:toxin CptA
LTQNLAVALRPSRILALALTLVAGAALASAAISLPGMALLPVAAGIALALVWHIPEALQRGERAVAALALDAEGGARWQDRSGRWHEAEILPGSYVSGWLVVLNLAEDGRRSRSLVLLPDSAAAEELRRLRVWLRWRLGRP